MKHIVTTYYFLFGYSLIFFVEADIVDEDCQALFANHRSSFCDFSTNWGFAIYLATGLVLPIGAAIANHLALSLRRR